MGYVAWHVASLELLAPQPAALLGRESMVNNLQCTNGPLRPHVWKDHVHREEPVFVKILASAPRLDPEPQPEIPETEGGSNFEKLPPQICQKCKILVFSTGACFEGSSAREAVNN